MAGGSELGKSNETRFHSCILIDDIGQCGNSSGSNLTPGKIVSFVDEDLATFVCGDAKNAYDWTWRGQDKDRSKWGDGWEPVMSTPNDFRYQKGSESHLDKPWFDKDHWLRVGEPTRICQKKWNSVRRAFRTAGIVRGKRPYAFIIDDIQKDDSVHNYKWLMQLSADLEVAPDRIGYRYDEEQKIGDITLCGSDSQRDENDALISAIAHV